MWLKPGKKYLFGRVKRDGVRYALDHKTISRKHFIISVDDVKAGDSARIHARTNITITDEKSKHGTYIDGMLLQGGSRNLSSEKHAIRPGTFPSELVIGWVPYILTFSLTKKEVKAGVLQSKVERLEGLDVKVSGDYISGITTHVVAAKRNTVKGLQALIQGKYLVADSFIDSLVYAATPADLGEEENLSPIEQNFDKAWPKEQDHLAPPGKEPTERPVAAYNPSSRRVNVFEDFQFVFLDKSQYENLLPVITTGQGKALHYELRTAQTTADDLIQYMRNAAGKKGFGDVDEDSPKGGAVLVRPEIQDDREEWTNDLVNEVCLKLDQRAISQGEFLDSILATDASLLRKSVAFESTTDGRRPPPATPVESFASLQLPPKRKLPFSNGTRQSQEEQVHSFPAGAEQTTETAGSAPGATQRIPSSAPEALPQGQAPPVQEPPRKKPRLRHTAGNRFKNFDDEFDEDAVPSYTQEDFPDESQSQNASLNGSREHSINHAIKNEPASARKRQRSPEPKPTEIEDSEEDLMNDMFPAAAAMKRQRAGLPAAQNFVPPPIVKKKKETQIDVREVARAQRRAEEEAAKKEREDAAEAQADDHLGKPANLVRIQLMPLRTKPPVTATRRSADASERWDPKWNGRKNFKRFRRSGAQNGTEPRKRIQKVFVPLVEVKTSTFGMGDQYWDSERRSKKRTGMSQSQSQNQSQKRRATQSTSQTVSDRSDIVELSSDVDEEEPRTSPQVTRLQAEAASIVDHAVDTESPQRTCLGDKTQSANTWTSQKRPASKSGPAGRDKRQKIISTARDRGDDSDSDGMKFKFGRRKK
jgi:hypothetical protein